MLSEHQTKFDTFYGKRLSLKEWARNRRESKAAGRFVENTYSTPWHCQWQIHRDGGTDITGEWQASNSWTAKKIIRPSYDQYTAVYLIVHIYGGYKKGSWGVKPKHWSAELQLGWYGSWFFERKYARSCSSVTDACRKAEKLSFLDEDVAALLKRVYSPHRAHAVFRKEGEEYIPYMTALGAARDPMSWDYGNYFQTYWERPWQGPQKGQTVIYGSELNRSGWGYSGGALLPFERNQELTTKLSCWLPAPPEEARV